MEDAEDDKDLKAAEPTAPEASDTKPADVEMKQTEEQPAAQEEAPVAPVTQPAEVPHSQLLWATGAASGAQAQQQQDDDDIEPYDSPLEDRSEMSIDDETKTKCAHAQSRDSNGLFTLQLTTY